MRNNFRLFALWLALLWSGVVHAHRIDHLTVTTDVAADGQSWTLEVSAEARRVLEATQSLSAYPRLLRGGEEAEQIKPELFLRAAEYFPPRLALAVDGAAQAWPELAWSLLIVDEKDAVAPGELANPDAKHYFLVGRATQPLPAGARTYQVTASGDTVVLAVTKHAGQPQGDAQPFFAGQTSPPLSLVPAPPPPPPSFGEAFVRYLKVGYDHILPPGQWLDFVKGKLRGAPGWEFPDGLDHIFFVLGLFFLCRKLGPLVWQITGFTVAHSITLALSMLDVVKLPDRPVEIVIALSIAFVALENLFTDKLTKWRPAVVFGFGLIHGLGFAGAFKEFGLPEGQFFAALLSFNVGVELGQLTVVALALLAFGWAWRKPWYRKVIAVPASLLIAAVGLYWAIERMWGE